jgi:hypothetical protein
MKMRISSYSVEIVTCQFIKVVMGLNNCQKEIGFAITATYSASKEG